MSVLGIDVGGSKSVCLLADDDGQVLVSVRGEGANLHEAGELALEKAIHALMQSTLSGVSDAPSAICLGIAGVDRPSDEAVVRAIMQRIGHKARVIVVNDALIALQAGIDREPGIVIVAGTGSIAYGRSRHGVAARAGGWGFLLGDEGSAYWIGRLALRAVVRDADGRGRPTGLSALLLEHFGVGRAAELIHTIYQEELSARAIAALAPYVERAHGEGDAVAGSILDRAVDELISAAAAVMRRLNMQADAFSFVIAGGMFKAVPSLRRQLEMSLPPLAPAARVVTLAEEPALGAVRLALEELRGGAHVPAYTS